MPEKKTPQDHLPSLKKARTKTLWFATDFDLVEELEQLQKQDGLAGLVGTAAATAAEELRQAKVTELREKLRKTSVKVVIRSLTRKAYDDLVTAHPPTEEQLEEYKSSRQKPQFNLDTYPMALVLESIVEPEASKEDLEAWFNSDAWSGGEFTELFTACIQINSQSNVLNLGKG